MRAQSVLALFFILSPLTSLAQENQLPPKDRDKRLPPVLPGEVLETEQGDKIKVWSSAGPVPVNTVISQPTAPVGGILLDKRNVQRPGIPYGNQGQ